MFSVLSRGRDSGIWIDGPEVATAPPNPADEPGPSQQPAQPVVSPSPGPVVNSVPMANPGPVVNSVPVANRGPVANSGPVANRGPAPLCGPVDRPVANSGPVANRGPRAIPGPVASLISMGFSRLDAEQALRQTNNDVSRAASLLVRR